jgi:hypothetical protein
VEADVTKTETASNTIETWAVCMAFVLGMTYSPTGVMWGLLGLCVFPSGVFLIAHLACRAWTPEQVSRGKRWIGGVFIAFAVWQMAQNAQQTSHMVCTQETGGRDPDCVEWMRVPGGDSEGVLMWALLGGIMLWRIAQPFAPRVTSDDGMSDDGLGQRASLRAATGGARYSIISLDTRDSP